MKESSAAIRQDLQPQLVRCCHRNCRYKCDFESVKIKDLSTFVAEGNLLLPVNSHPDTKVTHAG